MITDLEPLAVVSSLSSRGEGRGEEAVASPPQTDFPNWRSHIMARSGNEFQIGDLLFRRVAGDQFLIWNADGEMLQNESAKVESTLREFFNEEF